MSDSFAVGVQQIKGITGRLNWLWTCTNIWIYAYLQKIWIANVDERCNIFKGLFLITFSDCYIWWDYPNHLSPINSQIMSNGCIKSIVTSSNTRSKGSMALLTVFGFIHSVSDPTSAAIWTKFRNHDTCLKNKMLIRWNGLGLYLESRNVNRW